VLQHLKERRQSEEGFTLIELMVVVLIMGILMAIAIPTFLATRGSANDASAKSNATNAFTNEKSYYASNQVFLDAPTATNGNTLDDTLPWGNNAKGQVSALAFQTDNGGTLSGATEGNGSVVVIEAYSKSGNCYYIVDDETSGTSAVIGYAESTGNTGAFCATPTGIPTTQGAVTSGNASQHAVASGGAPTGTDWYSSW
jgi:type IV pilus assembly protein PilA